MDGKERGVCPICRQNFVKLSGSQVFCSIRCSHVLKSIREEGEPKEVRAILRERGIEDKDIRLMLNLPKRNWPRY